MTCREIILESNPPKSALKCVYISMGKNKCPNFEQEFDALFRRLDDTLVNELREQFGTEAEDLVQEAWLNAWKFRWDFLGKSSLETWVRQILLNVVRNYVERDLKKRPPTITETGIPIEILVRGGGLG